MSKDLFSGQPQILGGLSNEEDLVKQCPPEFRQGNDWSGYASSLFFEGGQVSHWKWKSDDDEIKGKQMACFHGLLSTFGIGHHEKESVAGWMLSEMLEEVPEHIKAKEKTG